MDTCPYLGIGETRNIVGAEIGMNGRQYDRAKYVAKHATLEIIEELDSGKREIRPIYDELRAKENEEKLKSEPELKPKPLSNPPVKHLSSDEHYAKMQAQEDE